MSLKDIYERYNEEIQFLMIYIREAHPQDGWSMNLSGPLYTGGLYPKDVYDPQTFEERQEIAGRCEQSLAYDIPTYVDDINDTVNKAYAAQPTRLYLVDQTGRIAYGGGVGPYGYHPAELQAAIETLLVTEKIKS